MMPGNNTTSGVNGSGQPLREIPGQGVSEDTITQGPDWLVDLFFSPPAWVNPVIKLLGVLAVCIVAYRLYQWDGDIPVDAQRDMLIIAGTVTGTITATLAVMNVASVPYWMDVSIGFGIGYGLVLGLQFDAVQRRLPSRGGTRERYLSMWFIIGAGVLVLPEVVSIRSLGFSLLKSRLILACLATGMILLNGRKITDTDST